MLKIVEKTPEEIESIIAAVKEVSLPDEILEVVLYGEASTKLNKGRNFQLTDYIK